MLVPHIWIGLQVQLWPAAETSINFVGALKQQMCSLEERGISEPCQGKGLDKCTYKRRRDWLGYQKHTIEVQSANSHK